MLPKKIPKIIVSTHRLHQEKKQVAPERLLPTCLTFSKSLMVTVSVFKFGENGSDIGRSWSEDQWRILPDESSLR